MTRTYTPEEMEWAGTEVARQGAGPEAIPHFLAGWDYARNEFFPHDKDTLEQQVRIVHRHVIDWADPKWMGKQQYRETPVVFANGNEGADWRFIPRLMTQLCESDLLWTDPEAFVVEFLSIHPFEDGNGRTASIVLNRRLRSKGFIVGGIGNQTPEEADQWNKTFHDLPEVGGWVQHA